MRRTLLSLAFLLGTAGTVHAQTVTWLDLARSNDSRTATKGDAVDVLAMQPLRLGLLSGYVPQPSSDLFNPGCRDAPAYAGAATGMSAFPTQQTVGLRVFGPPPSWSARRALATPRLTLFGTSRVGCGVDAAAGGGGTFTVGITKDVFFVLSAGAIFLPQLPQGTGAPRRTTEVRADVVIQGKNARSYSLGVALRNGMPQLGVGGVW